MAKMGKRLTKAHENLDPHASYELDTAVKMVKERATAKFDETIELSMNLGVDPRHADQMVRGMISLPKGTGKSVRVAVFAKGDKEQEEKMSKNAGAKTACEMRADRRTGQTTLTNTIHHAHVGAEEPRIADADGCIDAYSISINDSAFQELRHHRK